MIRSASSAHAAHTVQLTGRAATDLALGEIRYSLRSTKSSAALPAMNRSIRPSTT
jgi:hypothetical protein